MIFTCLFVWFFFVDLHLFVDSLTGVLVDRLTCLSELLDLLFVTLLLCLLYVLGVPYLENFTIGYEQREI